MRLVEEVYVKAEKDEICQKCGVDIPEGRRTRIMGHLSSMVQLRTITSYSIKH